MARAYGAIKSTVWEPGSDFRDLSPIAQWAYLMLLSQPQINNLGLLAYTPGKWARLAAHLDVGEVVTAVDELAAARYVLVDFDAGELLVRTFVRHDKVWAQPKLVVSARRQIREVESDEIRACLVGAHPWLVDDRDKDAIRAFEEASSSSPETPTDTPSPTPFQKTGGEQGIQDAGSRGVGSSRSRDKSTEARPDANDERLGLPAAASASEPVPLERAVASLATLTGWDSGSLAIVAPRLQDVPGVLFEEVLSKTRLKRARDEVAMFNFLLGIAISDWRQSQHQEQLDRWDAAFGEAGIERVKREDPERYVLAWAAPSLDAVRPLPPHAVVSHVLDYLFEYVPDTGERLRLLEAFVHAAERQPAFGTLRDWILMAIDRRRFSFDEVIEAVELLVSDEQLRAQLIRFAEDVQANVDDARSDTSTARSAA